jgi:hypothetical protein
MAVYVTDNSPEAHIIVGRLESEGIRSWIYQEAAGSAFGITVGALGTVQVLVNPEDYERAKAILAIEYTDEPWLEDGLDDDDEFGDE